MKSDDVGRECTLLSVIRINRQQLDHLDTTPTTPDDTGPTTTPIIQTITTPVTLAADVDDENFAILHLKARPIPVAIGSRFASQEDLYSATDASGHPARILDFKHDMQRTVAAAPALDFAAGWASLEDPRFQGDEVFDGTRPRPLIYALVVSRVSDIKAGTLGLGYINLRGTHEAFNALFVVPTEKLVNGFERIGRGVLFGIEVEAAFKRATKRDVWLV